MSTEMRIFQRRMVIYFFKTTIFVMSSLKQKDNREPAFPRALKVAEIGYTSFFCLSLIPSFILCRSANQQKVEFDVRIMVSSFHILSHRSEARELYL